MAKLSQLDGTNGFRLDGIDGGDVSGASVAGAGDVNGDGIDDLIIGAYRADPGDRYSAGESYVVFGTAAGFDASLDLAALDGANGFRLDGIDNYDNSGASVAAAGDINGDGIDDLIIGAPGGDPGDGYDAGESYVVFGTAAGFGASLDLAALDGSNGFRLDGIDTNDYSGVSVAAAGDINGDGIDDLIIGAPGGDPGDGYDAGESYVVFGTAAGFGASLDLAALDGADGFRLDGIDTYDNSGVSVAAAGDINGDGIDDLIIGAQRADPGERYSAGESYVVFGTAAGFGASFDLAALDGADGFRLDGIDGGDYSGVSVAAAGDVNGDGIDDLIIGAPQADPGDRYAAGESYVVFGTAAGFGASLDLAALDGDNGFRLDGIDNYDNSGVSVAAAGDINGDGIDDLIIGARGADTGGRYAAGEIYVLFGTAAGFGASLDLAALDGANGFRLDGIDTYDNSGASVAGAGDINGDGIDDLIIGAPGAAPGGESYVIYGSTQLGGANDAPLAADDLLRVTSFEVVDLAGDNGAGADRDPDFDDLAITAIDGTPVTTGDSVTLASGLRVTVVGPTEVRFDAPGLPLGTSLSDSFVYEVSDGRGGSDTATVSFEFDHNAISLADLDGTNGFRLVGSSYDNTGASVASAGDINGDGIDDLIIGAPRARRYDAGQSYLVFGTTEGFDATLDLSALDGDNGFRLIGAYAYDLSGASVAGAGDINGDGIDDLIIGAPSADPGDRYDAGESYVVFGTAGGFGASLDLAALDGADGFRLDGIDNYDNSGVSVAGAGDINGDGIDDLIIGAYRADPGDRYAAGESYVVFGTAAGFGASLDLAALDGDNGFRLDGIDNYDNSGVSVAAAGDVNGDGIDDLIIGADRAGPGDRSAGESYVVFGTAAGFGASLDLAALDGANGFRLDVIDNDDNSGVSVAAAGDINGDGIDDLIIGAQGADPGGRYSAGESYVVYGTAAGFGASLDLAALDGANGFRLDGIDGGDYSGVSVAAAGDVNGDGIDDLIIGAPGGDPGDRYAAGESYVVFGTAAGFGASLDLAALDGADGFRLDGIDTYDNSGASVAGAGDVNGDGIDDLIIGAPGADESYVVFGFRSVGTGVRSASVAASSDDAEQSTAAARIQLGSHELEIGQTANKLVGLRFSGLDIPDGATVTEAYIEFEAARSDACASRITIAIEDSTDAATYGRSAGTISARSYLDDTTHWSPEAWVEGETYRTADLAATIAALVGADGLDLDEALAFRFTGAGEREAAAFDSVGAAPKLVIEFETGSPETPPVLVDDLTDELDRFPRLIAEPANDGDPDRDSFRFARVTDGDFSGPSDEFLIM